MIINFASIIAMMILFYLLGHCIINMFQMNNRFEWACMPIGASVVVVFTSFLYLRADVRLSTIGYVWGVVLVLLIILLILSIIKFKLSENELKGLLITFAFFVVLIIPGVIRGDQYYVYRGNFWDHNIYLSEAITAFQYKWSELNALPEMVNDVYTYGYYLLSNDRPLDFTLYV